MLPCQERTKTEPVQKALTRRLHTGNPGALNILRLQSPVAHDHVKGDVLTLVQSLEPLAHNRGVMDEYVLTC